MNKYILSILLVLATGAKAQSLQFEAGLSYVHVTDADYRTSPAPFSVTEDQSAWAPYVGVRTELSSKIALRVAYQAIPELEATANYLYPPFRPGEVVTLIARPQRVQYRDKIHIVTFGPQFLFQVRPSLLFIVSPEASWVHSRGTVQFSYPDNLSGGGIFSRKDQKVTLGGSASLNYAFNSHWSTELGYRLVDVDPSLDRKLHLFSGGLLFKF